MRAVADRPEFELEVVCSGTMVLERFDHTVDMVRADGFNVVSEVFMELEGSTPTTMAKSLGFSVIEFATQFQQLKPDIVLMIGDRYEALGALLAAAYMNLLLVHVQGGEVSGSIDESARHAMSKFSHYHCPSTDRAAEYLIRMGERPDTILAVGCPSSDIAAELSPGLDPAVVNSHGSGASIDVDEPWLLVVFHPATTEYGDESDQIRQLLEALKRVGLPTVMLWPNIDAGSNHISKAIRTFVNTEDTGGWLRIITHVVPDNYLRMLRSASCCIGNSSSFVRDAGYFGTPVVLVGSRQDGRERDAHVTRVDVEADLVETTIRAQVDHGRYAPSTLYGDGKVAARVAEALTTVEPYVQKRLHYVSEEL